MAETTEMRSQRLKAVEDFTLKVDKAKNKWRDAKEKLTQARKEYERDLDALVGMIREKLDTPLFDTDEE